MTIRELRNVSSGIMHTAELIVVANDDTSKQTTLSLGDYETYAKYADNEIILLEQGVYAEYHSDFTRQGSVSVKPKLIVYVYEKEEQND